MSKMQITIEPTEHVGQYLGLPCRIWQGNVVAGGQVPGVTNAKVEIGQQLVLVVAAVMTPNHLAICPGGFQVSGLAAACEQVDRDRINELVSERVRSAVEPSLN